MRKFTLMLGLLGLMVAISAPSQAQQFDPAMFKLIQPVTKIIGSSPARLMSNKSVQTELKLDDEQKKAVDEKFPAFGGFGGFGKGGNTDAMERFQKMMEKAGQLKDVPEDKLEEKIREVFKDEIAQPMKDAEKILKPEQLKRLTQISRQQSGLGVYTDEAKALKLTDDQVKKVKDIRTDLDKDVGEIRRAAGGGMGMGGFGGFRPLSAEAQAKVTKLTKEASESAEKVLSDDQKKTLKELMGEPFEFKRDEFKFPMKKKKDD